MASALWWRRPWGDTRGSSARNCERVHSRGSRRKRRLAWRFSTACWKLDARNPSALIVRQGNNPYHLPLVRPTLAPCTNAAEVEPNSMADDFCRKTVAIVEVCIYAHILPRTDIPVKLSIPHAPTPNRTESFARCFTKR